MQLDAPVLWLVMQGSACMYVYIVALNLLALLYSYKSSNTDAECAARCGAMRSLADNLDASSSCDLRARVTGAHFACFTGTIKCKYWRRRRCRHPITPRCALSRASISAKVLSLLALLAHQYKYWRRGAALPERRCQRWRRKTRAAMRWWRRKTRAAMRWYATMRCGSTMMRCGCVRRAMSQRRWPVCLHPQQSASVLSCEGLCGTSKAKELIV